MRNIFRLKQNPILNNDLFRNRFPHYLGVIQGNRVAKFLVAKKLSTIEPLSSSLSVEKLWNLHSLLENRFADLCEKINADPSVRNELETPEYNDLKLLIARKILENCHMCERRCGINRYQTSSGFCRLSDKSIISSAFLHYGEEPPLVPSGTIFFSGCTFKCKFCQNWSISQRWGTATTPREGRNVTPESLSQIIDKLSESGAININWVGGDPTPNLHTILATLTFTEKNVIQLWNSNMYASSETMRLLFDIIDFWLPDLKFFDNDFAYTMTHASNYWEIVTRNIKDAYNKSSKEMIVRHLIMPTRADSDSKSILNWCAKNIKLALVNIMDQYRSEHEIRRNEEFNFLNRGITKSEWKGVRKLADKLGIEWKSVSSQRFEYY
ncbi:MAG: radical SAM protein [Candidatus Hodarchaeales archaeon]